MARAELLISLVKAGMRVDRNAVRAAAENIIADEKSKQHNILADRIARALQTTKAIDGSRPSALFLHQPNDKGRQALAEVTAKHRLDDLVLNPQTRSNIDSLVEEQRQANHLKANNLEPRHRIMLIGPPGNGKTSLAEAIAQALAVPFFVIRYDCLIGSYLGETAQRLKQTLDYVKAAPCVLFFDEFDTIGKERGDTNETGEIKRVVSSLLMQVDELPSHTIIIAASNHPELLDRATWRRFQLRLPLPAPTQNELASYLQQQLKQLKGDPGMPPSTLAAKLGEISYAEARDFMLDLRRQEVLSIHKRKLGTILAECLQTWNSRARSSESDKNKTTKGN